MVWPVGLVEGDLLVGGVALCDGLAQMGTGRGMQLTPGDGLAAAGLIVPEPAMAKAMAPLAGRVKAHTRHARDELSRPIGRLSQDPPSDLP